MASGAAGRKPTRAFELGGECVLILESGHLSGGQSVEGYVLVRGDFSCGPDCRFARPIYVGGNCEIGKGSQFDSLVADGNLVLSPSVRAGGSVASAGEMELRCGCRIANKASSQASIRLNLHVEAGALSAPEIHTPRQVEIQQGVTLAEGNDVVEIRPPGDAATSGRAGEEGSRFQPYGADTWFYDGDLVLLLPVYLRSHLVVSGAFQCPPGSLIGGDVKAGGSLRVGSGSLAQGNLLADGDVILEPGCIFQGNIHSRQMLRLSSGVRGLRPDGPVMVTSAGELAMEESVSVRGSLSSGARLKVGSAASAGQNLAAIAAT